MRTKSIILFISTWISVTALASQDSKEDTTRIPDYSWLAGSWIGDGFGGTSEEIWSPPSADGTMMGVYRHHKADGTLSFYEFLVLDSTGIRLKHFTPELAGWETREDFITFEMISFTADRIEMKGLLIARKSENELEISLKMRRDGKVEMEVFRMRRRE